MAIVGVMHFQYTTKSVTATLRFHPGKKAGHSFVFASIQTAIFSAGQFEQAVPVALYVLCAKVE